MAQHLHLPLYPRRTAGRRHEYTARIAAGLADTTGGVLAEDYEWSFSTQPPQVVWVSPSGGRGARAGGHRRSGHFNMPVDCDFGGGNAFSLRAGLRSVPGDFECEENTFIFTPTERLAFDTTYTAQVDAGVRSAGGGRGMQSDYEWRFNTVPLPRIIGTDPRDGEQNAWPYTSFEIKFNAPIDPSTVMPNLEMTPPLSPTQVYTYFNTWDNTFVLNFGAEPITDYEVRIGPDIADPYGNTTGQEMTVASAPRRSTPRPVRMPDCSAPTTRTSRPASSPATSTPPGST